MNNRKEKVLAYMEKVIPAGVFRIKNKANGKVFLGSAPNLDGAWNKHLFTLEAGVHTSKQLQADWTEFGKDAFEFEVLEVLKRKEGERQLSKADLDRLKKLEETWFSQMDASLVYPKFK